MVWMPAQFGAFLDQAEADGERLAPLFHLMGFCGLRRGEAIGQGWTDVNLDGGELTVSTEIVTDGWTPYESKPKTESSAATIGLDTATVAVLRAHRARQTGSGCSGARRGRTPGRCSRGRTDPGSTRRRCQRRSAASAPARTFR